uniref:Anoctamin n=1 Tax=Macrostomum lignano TaxID=282301 RepID=A0A1I8HU17_9PLAT
DPLLLSYRQRFEANLRKAGLQLEEEVSSSDKKKIHFVKLFIPWDAMCYHAELMSLRAPLLVHPNPTASNWSAQVLSSLRLPNPMDQEVPKKPADLYTCPFRKSKLNRFLGNENPTTFFTTTQRHQVAREILGTMAYGQGKQPEIGIDRLLEEGVYSGGPYELPKSADGLATEDLNSRQILQAYWARWSQWYKYQPLDHIREYFGEKIGIYFAWLGECLEVKYGSRGLYTCWLLPASLVGLAVFAYGCFTFHSNVPAEEICNSSQEFKMCPLCDEAIGCQYWYLSDTCVYAKIAYLFDHPGTVLYAVFVSLWAVAFLEAWKRKSASLAHHWDVADFEEQQERPRPEFAAQCTAYKTNPVTGQVEPHFPDKQRIPRLITGIASIAVMVTDYIEVRFSTELGRGQLYRLVVVFIFLAAVVAYRLLVSVPLFRNPLFHARANLLANASAAVLNLIIIMCLGQVYEKLAYRITQWEMHRTQTEFEDQLALKVSIFQIVNYYSSIVYIAFFKGKFMGLPGRYLTFLGLRNEECDSGGCLIELAQQLGVIMIGKQIINNCQEFVLPKLASWIHRFRSGLKSSTAAEMDDSNESSGQRLTRCEADYRLVPYEGLFDEYLEMVLQFGFITIFVAAFPLAPLFALLNNWLEIRLDAGKLVRDTRRPVSERAQGIGIWFSLLEVMVKLSVISNAFLIAFTSEFLPRQLYRHVVDSELRGYANFSLAWAPPNATSQPCRYRAFRDADGNYSMFHWRLLAVRLGFVILFEHVVFFTSRLLDLLIPDVPETVRIKMRREQYLGRQALMDAEIKTKSAN